MAQQVANVTRNPLSHGGQTAIVVSFIFSFLATIAVGLRLYVRRIKRIGVLMEDWLILAALVCPSVTGGILAGPGGFELTCL